MREQGREQGSGGSERGSGPAGRPAPVSELGMWSGPCGPSPGRAGTAEPRGVGVPWAGRARCGAASRPVHGRSPLSAQAVMCAEHGLGRWSTCGQAVRNMDGTRGGGGEDRRGIVRVGRE